MEICSHKKLIVFIKRIHLKSLLEVDGQKWSENELK